MRATSKHSTSVNLGLAADSIAQADYDMAPLGDDEDQEWFHGLHGPDGPGESELDSDNDSVAPLVPDNRHLSDNVMATSLVRSLEMYS